MYSVNPYQGSHFPTALALTHIVTTKNSDAQGLMFQDRSCHPWSLLYEAVRGRTLWQSVLPTLASAKPNAPTTFGIQLQ